jgi:hypothetical protein
MKKKLHKLIVLFLLCSLHTAAQTTGYNYEAPITPVDSSGFYNIVLTPELNAHLKTDYSDLRIVNDSGKWVPHLGRLVDDSYCSLPTIIKLEIAQLTNTNNYTDVIVKGTGSKIFELDISLENTVAERFCSLTGSDDMKLWFTINDSIHIKPIEIMDADKRTFTLNFPPVNYKYYRVRIINNNKAPFNIKVVSTINETVINKEVLLYGEEIENPATQILQKDSNRNSYIKVVQNSLYHFWEITIKTSGAKYYNREAELFIPFSNTHSFSNPGKLIKRFVISNNSTLEFRFGSTNAQIFYIIVHNDDNPPLKFEEVKTFTNSRVATVYLEKGEVYKLLLDNSSIAEPNYDLTIKDIPLKEVIPLATIGKIISIQKPTIPPQAKDNSKKLIWLVIALAAIVLTFFTYRLVTDMNKSKS